MCHLCPWGRRPHQLPWGMGDATPVSPKTILPEKPFTRWGYPRGESKGDSSGWCPSLLPFDGCIDQLPGKIPGLFTFDNAKLVSSKPFYQKGNHHHLYNEEREARDKRLFVYRYNQGGEKTHRDNPSRPYPLYTNIHNWFKTSKYCHDQFRELSLGDLVMAGKEWWRKHMRGLHLEGFPKAWITRGLREIHHIGDHMDGRMDTCLGYPAVLGAEIYELIGEIRDELKDDQKKRSLDGWERMNVKRELEDSLCDAQGEMSGLTLSITPLEQRWVREGGLPNPNLGSPKWFMGLSRVPLAGPRYGLSWGCPGFQG